MVGIVGMFDNLYDDVPANIPIAVPPKPVVSAGLPAFNWYLASALVVPIEGNAVKILGALAMAVITLPVPTPQLIGVLYCTPSL